MIDVTVVFRGGRLRRVSIVLTGFAGAAIAAELGTMVVGEEIEALEAQVLRLIEGLPG